MSSGDGDDRMILTEEGDGEPSEHVPNDRYTIDMSNISSERYVYALRLVELIVGILFISISASKSDEYTIGGYIILILFGVFLAVDAVVSVIPFARINFKYGSREIPLNLNLDLIRLTLLLLLSVIMMIVACTTGPSYYWRSGNIAALVISIILILVFGTCLAVKLGLKLQINVDLQGLSGLEKFCYAVLDKVSFGCIRPISNEDCKKSIKSNRFFLGLLCVVVTCLILMVATQEFLLIKNWSCDLYAQNSLIWSTYLDGPFGFYTVTCNCEYWAAISASCTIFILSLIIAGIIKPSGPIACAVAVFSLAYGVYMTLLSWYSVQSLMLLNNITAEVTDNLPFDGTANRFMHLLPIQFIAFLLIVIGLVFTFNCFDLETNEASSRMLRYGMMLLCLIVIPVSLANILISQVNTTDQLRKHWINRNTIDPKYMEGYMFYMIATMFMSLTLFTCALVRVAVRNVKIPGVACWFMGLIQLGLAIFSMYTIFHASGTDSKAKVIILQDTPTTIMALNVITIILSAVSGLYNIMMNGLAALNFLLWLVAIMATPFVALILLTLISVKAINRRVD